jgi:hypothetical protein
LETWAVSAGGGKLLRSTSALAQSDELGPWLVEVETIAGKVRRLVLHAGDPKSSEDRQSFALRAVAQSTAVLHRIAAPAVVAVDDGSESGWLAILEEALSGTSRIPSIAEPTRLRALGREVARINAVRPATTAGLPTRSRSLEGVPFESLPIPDSCRAVFEHASELVGGMTCPTGGGFVHGDFWQGNTLWDGALFVGSVDWDYAGIGPGGIDLGSLRCDVAVMFGPDAADEVAVGWKEQFGDAPELLAYWDVVSCLSAPADLNFWLPNFHAQGRTDLDITTVTARRDAFLAAALSELR